MMRELWKEKRVWRMVEKERRGDERRYSYGYGGVECWRGWWVLEEFGLGEMGCAVLRGHGDCRL